MTRIIIRQHMNKKRIKMIPQNILWGKIDYYYNSIGEFEL